MKTTSLALVMAITLCAASVTLASDKPTYEILGRFVYFEVTKKF